MTTSQPTDRTKLTTLERIIVKGIETSPSAKCSSCGTWCLVASIEEVEDVTFFGVPTTEFLQVQFLACCSQPRVVPMSYETVIRCYFKSIAP